MRVKKLPATPTRSLLERATALGLWGIAEHWDELCDDELLGRIIDYEEKERQRRSLQRRIRNAKLGRFKPFADFDWNWPKSLDRELIEELFTFQFIDETANVILVGPNGIGKTMIAKNLAYQALLRGHTARFTSASGMLNELAGQDGALALKRCFSRYCSPQLLVIDEVGYLSYDNRHADLLFEIVTRRYGEKSTIVTTNKPFSEWNDVFPNATCVVTLVDRLVHRAEIVNLEGDSYRLKEAKERTAEKARRRRERKKTPSSSKGTASKKKQ